jgi:hypothetical protein
MAAPQSRIYISWSNTLFRPRQELKKVLADGAGISSFFFMLVAGILSIHFLSDVRNLGDKYEVGQLMSFALMIGPPLGLLFCAFFSLLLMASGCILDPKHQAKYERKIYDPSYFFWLLLLWKKWSIAFPLALLLFFGFRFLNLWKRPGLSTVRTAYSGVISQLNYFLSFISGGRTAWGRLHNGIGASLVSVMIIGLLNLIEFRWLEAANFSSQSVPMGGFSAFVFGILFPFLKFGLLAWFIYSLARMQELGFRIPFTRALLATTVSFIVSAAFLILVSSLLLSKALYAEAF